MVTFDDKGALPEPVECRLYEYPGADTRVLRWFVVGAAEPFMTRDEALRAYARRRWDHSPSPLVEVRLHTYPGSTEVCYRWFITGDHTPLPYRTADEAIAELRRRAAAGERGS